MASLLKDGEYKIDVSLDGGSGKASIESPVLLHVKDNEMSAEIEWSSPNYDYMEVNGQSFLPVNDSGNSRFIIDIDELDIDIPVKAETTAMSQPHMIEYTLHFDSSTARNINSSPGGVITGCITGACVLAAAAVILLRRVRRVK